MASHSESKIKEIRKRIKEYHEHKNDPYAYFPEEIDAIRGLHSHAVEDIEFLLHEVTTLIIDARLHS